MSKTKKGKLWNSDWSIRLKVWPSYQVAFSFIMPKK